MRTASRKAERSGAGRAATRIGHGRQVVAGYSVRPLPYAPVATPLDWDELNPRLDPREHNLQTVPARVAKLGDLHAPLLRGRQLLEIGTRLRNNS
jgi:DNA primase